jgi:signal transduction histidine kinase
MAPVAAQKDISINMLYDDDADLRVLYDKDRMEQVIMNILSNSVKYTENGGRIDVDCYREKKRVKIVISDTGIGIPEDKLPRIFERFYRVDKARSRSMGSSGLGLSISKHIVEEHNGTIEVASRLGEGTTMIIRLPLAYSRGVPNIE